MVFLAFLALVGLTGAGAGPATGASAGTSAGAGAASAGWSFISCIFCNNAARAAAWAAESSARTGMPAKRTAAHVSGNNLEILIRLLFSTQLIAGNDRACHWVVS